MNTDELPKKLSYAYSNAADKETAVTIHLFGIKYANEIAVFGSVKRLIELSGIPATYQTEISKGIKLSKFVSLNDNAPI